MSRQSIISTLILMLIMAITWPMDALAKKKQSAYQPIFGKTQIGTGISFTGDPYQYRIYFYPNHTYRSQFKLRNTRWSYVLKGKWWINKSGYFCRRHNRGGSLISGCAKVVKTNSGVRYKRVSGNIGNGTGRWVNGNRIK